MSLPNYQRRLAELGSRYIPRGEQIAGVDFYKLPNGVVPKFSEMMRERVEANLRRTDNLDPMIRMTGCPSHDDNTDGKIREFYRARPFTDYFKCPSAGWWDQRARGSERYTSNAARSGEYVVLTEGRGTVKIISMPPLASASGAQLHPMGTDASQDQSAIFGPRGMP